MSITVEFTILQFLHKEGLLRYSAKVIRQISFISNKIVVIFIFKQKKGVSSISMLLQIKCLVSVQESMLPCKTFFLFQIWKFKTPLNIAAVEDQTTLEKNLEQIYPHFPGVKFRPGWNVSHSYPAAWSEFRLSANCCFGCTLKGNVTICHSKKNTFFFFDFWDFAAEVMKLYDFFYP